MKWKRTSHTAENSPYWEWFWRKAKRSNSNDGAPREPAEANPDVLSESRGLPAIANENDETKHTIEMRKSKVKQIWELAKTRGIFKVLTKKQFKIIDLIFNEDLTEREVAKVLHMDHGLVHRQRDLAIKKMKKFIDRMSA